MRTMRRAASVKLNANPTHQGVAAAFHGSSNFGLDFRPNL
jgi:hypothetical protein